MHPSAAHALLVRVRVCCLDKLSFVGGAFHNFLQVVHCICYKELYAELVLQA